MMFLGSSWGVHYVHMTANSDSANNILNIVQYHLRITTAL